MQNTFYSEYMNSESLTPFLDMANLVPALNPVLVVDGAGLDKVRQFLSKVEDFGFDYETNVVDTFFHRRARTLQLGNRNEQYIIDLLAFAGSKEALIRAQGGYRDERMCAADRAVFQPVVDVVGSALQSNSHLKIGHNLEFEYIVSKWCLGMSIWHLYCTKIAERLLLNGKVSAFEKGVFGLQDVVRKYCNVQISKESQTTFDLETPLTEEQIVYCALDTRLVYPVRASQIKQVEATGAQFVTQIEMNAIPAMADMHLNGMYINPDKWRKISEDNKAALPGIIAELDEFFLPIVGPKKNMEAVKQRVADFEAAFKTTDTVTEAEEALSEQIRALRGDKPKQEELKVKRAVLQAERKAVREAAKAEFYAARKECGAVAQKEYENQQGKAAINYGSDSQLLAALHTGPWGLTPKNLKSTDAKRSLIKHNHLPVIKAIIKHRKLEKQTSTYGPEWLDSPEKNGYVQPETGRVHSKFSQLGADSGRPTSSAPNCLNLPKETKFRQCFEAQLGNVMVCRDCAGQELRILAEYSGEDSWIDAFLTDKDVHSISAHLFDKKGWEAGAESDCAYFTKNFKKCSCPKHKKERDKKKAVNFGVPYGKQAYSLAIELQISEDEAQKLIDLWENNFPKNAALLENVREKFYQQGYAVDLAGRRRYYKKVTWEMAKQAVANKLGAIVNDVTVKGMYEFMVAAIKRELCNHICQASGASLMKLAMGAGSDAEGKPFLWQVLEPKWGAKLLNFVYDEFLIECPEEHGEAVSAAVEDAIIRAGAMLVKKVPMASEGGVAKCWQK